MPQPHITSRRFAIAVAIGLLSLTPLFAQNEAPATTPNALMAEFLAQHDAGIARLGLAYASRLEAEKQRQMQAANLPAANAIAEAITQLQKAQPNQIIEIKDLTPEALNILKDHTAKQKSAVAALAQIYVARFESLKATLLKTGDLEGANAAERCRTDVSAMAKLPASPLAVDPAKAQEILIEAYIDGNSELHVTKEGLYWETHGNVAKPGLHNGVDFPTYINGSPWKPKWKLPQTRGADTCEPFPLITEAPSLTLEVISVSKERSGPTEDGRTPVKSLKKGSQFIVDISDPDGGARWHKFRLKPQKR